MSFSKPCTSNKMSAVTPKMRNGADKLDSLDMLKALRSLTTVISHANAFANSARSLLSATSLCGPDLVELQSSRRTDTRQDEKVGEEGDDLTFHEAQVTMAKCCLCAYSTNSGAQLNEHFLQIHCELGIRQCPRCEYFCCGYSKLRGHMARVHNDFSNLSSQPVSCAMCNYSTNRLSSLSDHIRHCHKVAMAIRRGGTEEPRDPINKRWSADSFAVNLNLTEAGASGVMVPNAIDNIYTASKIKENESSWRCHEQDLRKESQKLKTPNTRNEFMIYMLVDARKVQELLRKGGPLIDDDAGLMMFRDGIIYLGEGDPYRPPEHLKQAVKDNIVYSMDKQRFELPPKSRQMIECWESGHPVIILRVFQHSTMAEAKAKEACLIGAIGLPGLANKCNGTYKNLVKHWPEVKRLQYANLMLLQCYRKFMRDKPKGYFPRDLNLDPAMLKEAEKMMLAMKRRNQYSQISIGKDLVAGNGGVQHDEKNDGRYQHESQSDDPDDPSMMVSSDDDFLDQPSTSAGLKRKGSGGRDGLPSVEHSGSRKTGEQSRKMRKVAPDSLKMTDHFKAMKKKHVQPSCTSPANGRSVIKFRRTDDGWSVLPGN